MDIFYFLQHTTASQAPASEKGGIEEYIILAVQGLRLVVETIGAIIIGIGIMIALFYFVKSLLPPQIESFNKIRLVLARYLALALEFQLGADILSTAIAPSWDQIGKLGAIAVIRTALNYFLYLEMKEEQTNENKNADTSSTPDINNKDDNTQA